MEYGPFKSEHYDYLMKNGVTDKRLKPLMRPDAGKKLEEMGETYTILDDDGNPVFIGGIQQYWFNRGEAWVLFGSPKRSDFIKIHKVVQKFLDLSPIKRIEMVVDFDYAEGHRWARTLGFKKEAEEMKCYHVDGRSATLYALVKE